MAIPPLSSIDINSEESGFQAAALLDDLMSGRKPPHPLPKTRPAGVVTRRSTDVLATDDPDVVQAIRFIRERACDRIAVSDVLAQINVSRATLEPKFKAVLGRTFHQEIQRVQMERAKELLRATDLPIKAVAERAGFNSVQYLGRVFCAATGEPPAAYRGRGRMRMTDSAD